MITMSGSNLRAISSDSATVPASATTWNASRRSSRATRPWRTTSWSSTTSRRSGRVTALASRALASGTRAILPFESRVRRPGDRDADDDTRAAARLAVDFERPAERRRPRPHVGQAAVARAARGVRPKPRPLSAISRTSSSALGSARPLDPQDDPGPGRAGVAGDVAQRLAGDLEELDGGLVAEVRERVLGTLQLDVDHRVEPELVGQTGQAAEQADLVEPLGSQPEDEVADLADRQVQPLDRPLDPGPRLVRVVVHELGHVLEREADPVDALDDPVVEVLADPLALLDDRQALDLLVEPGVLDGDPGMEGEHLDERLVGLAELPRSCLFVR